jgi:hypothetical protein
MFVVDDDFSSFDIRWGNVVTDVPGQITVEADAGNDWVKGGIMMSGPGFGYGTYTFVAQSEFAAPGTYVCLWPQDNIFPGSELDLIEMRASPDVDGTRAYGVTHWSTKPAHTPQSEMEWSDHGYSVHNIPDLDISLPHQYSVEWFENNIWYSIDGRYVAKQVGEGVPRDAAHGGVNETPSLGTMVWPEIVDQQHGSQAVTLLAFAYAPWAY